MGAVLAQGAEAIGDWQGVLVALADMPEVQAESYELVASGLSGWLIHRPVYLGQPGHPVGFGARHFDALRRMEGDVGARSILQQQREHLVMLDVEDRGVILDVDTPDQLASFST